MAAINPKNFNVNPVWSPQVGGNPIVGSTTYWDRKTGYVRTAGDDPNIVLDYTRNREVLVCMADGRLLGSTITPCGGLVWGSFMSTNGQNPEFAITRNRAYDRFKEKVVGNSSQLGVFAAERREAYGMIANRAIGLYRAAKALRRGKFKQFIRELSVSPKRKHRNKVSAAANEFSGLWLEYWFGWSPTVSELYGLSETLTKELPVGTFRGTAKEKFSMKTHTGTPTNYTDIEATGVYRAGTGARVLFVNPDLFLLQSLGLANPISIINEATPFSFVLEWFVKYGAVIDSTTDFLGLELIDPWKSFKLSGVNRYIVRHAQGTNTVHSIAQSQGGFGQFRDQGLLRPTVVYPTWLNIWKPKTRAATAVSLLVQALTGRS